MLMTINPAKNDASYNWVNSNPGNQGPFVSGGAAFRTGDCSSERRIRANCPPRPSKSQAENGPLFRKQNKECGRLRSRRNGKTRHRLSRFGQQTGVATD